MIRITTIAGSVRPGNYTGKALSLIESEIDDHPEAELTRVDPAALKLPAPGQHGSLEDQDRLVASVRGATGVILATPEYHGSFSSVMKLVIENLGFPSVLSGKPVALLGVAAGQIGAIKSLEQLRSVCSHVGALVLPGPISVANVRTVFDSDGNCLDEAIEKRIRGVVHHLMEYISTSICPRFVLEQMVREG